MIGLAPAPGAASEAVLPFPGTASPLFRSARGPHRAVADGGLRLAPAPPAARRRRSPSAPIGMLGSILLSLWPAADACAEQRIGRLFSSLEQRMELDRMRNDPGPGKKAEPIADRAGPESRSGPAHGRPARAVTVNGVVLRSDGHRLAWINGVETVAGTRTSAGVRIEAQRTAGEGLRVRLPDGRTSTALKPGQTIDAKGRVHDVFEHRPAKAIPGMPDDRAGDSNAGETDENATGPRGAPEPPSLAVVSEPPVPPMLPRRLMQERLWRTQAGSAPPGTAAPDVPPDGGG